MEKNIIKMIDATKHGFNEFVLKEKLAILSGLFLSVFSLLFASFFYTLSDKYIQQVENKINNRPRKILKFQKLADVFFKHFYNFGA
ncbi:MAG: hypothetical protein LBF01_03680 [Bacteroidales bacterium]|jgi:hypothetical protein|nr:hypothetical protein [Bacteroidales bacterium]